MADLDNPISESPSSLAGMTMGAAISSRDAGVLVAAHPDASGMSGADDLDAPEDVIVTVVTEESREEEARSLFGASGRPSVKRVFCGLMVACNQNFTRIIP